MPIPTITQLNNCNLDVIHIADVATSVERTATDRKGNVKLTMQGAVDTIITFNPRGARVNGATYKLKDIYTEGGVSYATVVSSFVSVSVAADLAAGNVGIYQGLTNLDLLKPDASKNINLTDNLSTYSVQDWTNRSPMRLGKSSTADLPNFMRLLQTYDYNARPPVYAVLLGNSLGNGASLPSMTDAPGYQFFKSFKKYFDPDDRINLVIINRSVDGSTISDFNRAWDSFVLEGTPATFAFLVYNMNDCSPAQFNGGQTFFGFQRAWVRACAKLRKYKVDAILTTSPPPAGVNNPSIYSLGAGISQTWPVSKPVTAPVSPEQLAPPASASQVNVAIFDDGVFVSTDFRMKACNGVTRSLGAASGFPVVDAESFWLADMHDQRIKLGSMSLAEKQNFNDGQINHPNLRGITVSYGGASDYFWKSVSYQSAAPANNPDMIGYVVINSDGDTTPAKAVIDVRVPYLEGLPNPDNTASTLAVDTIRLWARTGIKDANNVRGEELAFSVNGKTGNTVIGDPTKGGIAFGYKFADSDHNVVDNTYFTETAYGITRKTISEGNPNALAGQGSLNREPFPINSAGRLTIVGHSGGASSPQIIEYLWRTTASALAITPITTAAAMGSGVFNASTSGLSLVVTPIQTAAIKLHWESM